MGMGDPQSGGREAPPKFKRPHFVASALRALAPAVNGMSTANVYLSETGQSSSAKMPDTT
jgi:hypothetical protein